MEHHLGAVIQSLQLARTVGVRRVVVRVTQGLDITTLTLEDVRLFLTADIYNVGRLRLICNR